MALTKTEVSQLYVSVFGRASEGEGNTYWQNDAAATDMSTTADIMLDTDAAKEYFGDTLNDNQKFIEHIYLNTLGKTATEDPDGVAYWVAQLEAGKSKGTVVAELISAAQDPANAGNAQDQFNNKVEVSDYTADTLEKFTTTEAFTGYISGVTHEASTVTDAKTAVDTDVPPVAGETFTLTTSADLVTGTAGDDIIQGYVGTNSANGQLMDTFQSVDVIDGGDGTDTLSVSSDTANANIGATINNVENMEFTTYKKGTSAGNLNMSNVTGLKTLTNKNSIAAFRVDNAKEVDLGVTNVNNNQTTVNFASTEYAAADDAATLTLNNATNQAKVTYTGANDIETLNIVTTGAASKVDLGGTALDGTKTVKITGDQDLSFDDTDGTTAMAAIKTLDASELTGTLDADLSSGGVVDLAVTGTAGHDKLTVANFTKADVLDLGEGTDKLTINMNANVTQATKIANVETIGIKGSGSYTLNLDELTTVTGLELYSGSDTTTITNAQAATTMATFVNVTGATAVDSLGFALEDASGKEDAMTFAFTNVNATTSVNESLAAGTQVSVASLTTTDIETINIGTSYLGAAHATDTTKKGGLSVTAVAGLTGAQTLNVESDTFVNLGGTLNANFKTIDASKAAAGITMDISAIGDTLTLTGTKTTSVTTGAGNDTLANINGDVQQTIKTGAGKDTLTLHGNADKKMDAKQTIDMGAGDDTVTVNEANLNDATAGSKLDFGADSDTMTVDVTGGNIDMSDVAISNLEKVVIKGGGNALTLDGASLSGAKTEFSLFNSSSLTWTGGTGADTIDASAITVLGATAMTITGLGGNDVITAKAGLNSAITGGTGGDTITLGSSDVLADTMNIATGDAAATIGGSGDAGTITGYDTVVNFAMSATGTIADILDYQVAGAVSTVTSTDGTDSTLTIGGKAVGANVAGGAGLQSFTFTGGGAVSVTDNASLAAVVQYLTTLDVGGVGDSVAFTGTMGGTASTWVYHQTATTTGAVGGYDLVQLTGITATGVATGNGATTVKMA
jgi:predicted  nucleic acid-binding Zn-ribbon protein